MRSQTLTALDSGGTGEGVGNRVAFRERAEGAEIQISVRKNWRFLIFCTVWLAIWTGSGAAALQLLKVDSEDRLFLVAWLVVWLPAEIFVGYAWLWGVLGKEVLRIAPAGLSHQRNLLGLGRVRLFNRSELHNLRASPSTAPVVSWEAAMAYWGINGGNIAFDYRGRTYRLGIELAESEARQLAQWVSARLA